MIEFKHKRFSIHEAAEHLRISPAMIYKLMHQKKLRKTKIGRRTIFSGAELERFLKDQQRAA